MKANEDDLFSKNWNLNEDSKLETDLEKDHASKDSFEKLWFSYLSYRTLDTFSLRSKNY